MALTFYYDFPNMGAYEYEADYGEAEDYILRTHSLDEILEDYIYYMYDKESDESKETLSTYDGFDGTKESIKNMSVEGKEDLVDEVLFDMLLDGIYNDELEDYFEQDAYDMLEDSVAENEMRRDSYYW